MCNIVVEDLIKYLYRIIFWDLFVSLPGSSARGCSLFTQQTCWSSSQAIAPEIGGIISSNEKKYTRLCKCVIRKNILFYDGE